jgi:N-ethylmaleimide reductase
VLAPSSRNGHIIVNAFDTYTLGDLLLKNRIVMSPMTRSRAQRDGTATDLMATYYAQRAGAGLIITEGTQPSSVGQGYPSTPGLHSAEQVDSWKPVTEAVHQAGGVIFAQLMHTGRIGHPTLLPAGLIPVAPSPVAAAGHGITYEGPKDFPVPHELTDHEIKSTIDDFVQAALNALAAGFDGVELHGANGYLIHQFLATNTNKRTDRWGGDVEGRIRFAVDVTTAVTSAIGGEHVGIRLSPGGTYNDMADDPDLGATYGALVSALAPLGLTYLHIMEMADRGLTRRLRAAWPHTLILNPNTGTDHTGPDALNLLDDGTTDLLSIGASFLANPDLPDRLAVGGPFNNPDPSTFYGGDHHGYTDYPTLGEQARSA